MSINFEQSLAHPTLSVDPIFGYVMTKKENCLKLLQLALPEKNLVRILKISPQKSVKFKYFERGDRYDVWAVDDQGHKFDIECQTAGQANIIDRLYRYLLKLQTVVEPLQPGEDVPKAHATYSICFETFKPGKEQRARYSISMHDDEILERSYDRLGHIVIFNTKALDRSMISKEMAEFLDLLDGRVSKNPSPFVIKLQDDITEFTDSEEWRDFMNEFQIYQKEFGDQKYKEGQTEGEKLGETNGAQKLIARLRQFKISDSQIMESLQEDYGTIFSTDQLKHMLEASK